MNSSIELQKQVKDNADDLRSYLSDLASWAGEMNNQSGEIKNRKSGGDTPIPPIRNHSKKRESNDTSRNTATSKISKRISSYNYDKWDKYDVEKACEEIDKNLKQEKTCKPDLKLQDEAQYEKERGNRFVKNGKWDDAVLCYSKAIKCYPKDATFYANRALCYLKKKEFRSVEADCTAALQLDDSYVKALGRRATARLELNQLEDALSDLNKALILEPNNAALKADLAVVKQKLTLTADSKPSITQTKEPLKWTPPSKVKSESCSSTSKLSSTAKTLKNSTSADSSSGPVVIEPAKKLDKKSQMPFNEDVKTKLLPKSPESKVETPKNVSAEPTEASDHSPIKWFDKEGITVVQSIVKPPHRRSKEPLKRISIRECPNYNLNADIESAIVAKKLEKEEKSRKVENIVQPNETNKIEDIKKLDDKKKSEKCKSDFFENASDLPVPTTSVQFIATWKLIQNNPKLCFEFLKKISADDIPKIFQDCLESDVLSGIISIMEGEFIKGNVPVYNYLLGLSKVRRFAMLAMFLSSTDKKGLQKLFDFCLTKESCSEESVNDLKNIYEM